MNADYVASKIWETYKPFKQMTYLEVKALAKRALEYAEGDEQKAIDILDRIIDPDLTYHENLELLERQIGKKPVELPEEAIEYQEKQYVRKRARELSVYEEFKREFMREPYTKEEAWEKLKLLTPLAEKYKEKFEEEWESIKDLPKTEQERILIFLAREIEREEIKPPEIKPVKREIKPVEIETFPFKPPEEYRDFYERWMRRYRESKI